MTYTLHRGAEQDLGDAARFYLREAGRGVAKRFLDEFERVAMLLADNPGLGTTTADERRSFPLSGFPYSVIYRPLPSTVRVLVVRHQHRDPDHGEDRR